jgi:hypothetical protein
VARQRAPARRTAGAAAGGNAPSGGGIEGNARLTALTGVLLLALLAAEGVTILFLGPLLPEHLFIGMLLIPPVALKLASTGYRFVRYYTRNAAYRLKGPPALVLRLMAPFLVVATLAVLGSGVGLIVTGSHGHDRLLTVHQVSFVVWLVLAGVHVLAYALRTPRLVGADVRRAPQGGRILGRRRRFALLAGALLTGLVLAIATLPLAHSWEGGRNDRESGTQSLGSALGQEGR